MVTGEPPRPSPPSPYHDRGALALTAAPLVLGLIVLLVLGLWIPAGLNATITHSAAVIG